MAEVPDCLRPGGCTTRRRCRELGWCRHERPTLEEVIVERAAKGVASVDRAVRSRYIIDPHTGIVIGCRLPVRFVPPEAVAA